SVSCYDSSEASEELDQIGFPARRDDLQKGLSRMAQSFVGVGFHGNLPQEFVAEFRIGFRPRLHPGTHGCHQVSPASLTPGTQGANTVRCGLRRFQLDAAYENSRSNKLHRS